MLSFYNVKELVMGDLGQTNDFGLDLGQGWGRGQA